jgi:general stress protein YciG
MAGTKIGSQKAKATNLAKDPDFYKKISVLGGKATTSRPFRNLDIARKASAKGLAVRRKNSLAKHSQQE